MSLSKRTLETLIDLVEIKLSCMEVYDRDDQRELANLERCVGELRSLMGGEAKAAAAVVAFSQDQRKAAAV